MESSGYRLKNKQEEMLLKENPQANNYTVALIAAGGLSK